MSILFGLLVAQAASTHVTVGTAFFVNQDGVAITNAHVVSHCKSDGIKARTALGNWYTAKLVATDKRYDLAAIKIDYVPEQFMSVRTFGNSTNVSVPEPTEDVFSGGFSDPKKNNFKIQLKWGQIQPWKDQSKFPYVAKMRMDAFPGASGSPVLDYAGLLVGVIFASSNSPADDTGHLRSIGYGDKWIYLYNNNAIVDFANSNGILLATWGQWSRLDPVQILGHAEQSVVLVECENST